MICFTICSNNYLYKARTLAASVSILSDAPVYLFLADEKDEKVNYDELNFHKIIYLDELGLSNLQWMIENYSIVEMNTAIKPFAFRYLFAKERAEKVYYFDPDIRLYCSMDRFDVFWGDNNILLTPHILTPIPFDGKFPDENLFLNHGIYNLGFLGLKDSKVTGSLLNWWSERMLEKCIIDLREGYFVDQLWFDLVPLFFKSTTVIEHRGCNVSYWNLHEREISLNHGIYTVNHKEPLIFFHFSGIDPNLKSINNNPNMRYDFEGRADLKQLYQEYLSALDKFNPVFYQSLRYFKGAYPLQKPSPTLFQKVLNKIKSVLK